LFFGGFGFFSHLFYVFLLFFDRNFFLVFGYVCVRMTTLDQGN